MKIEKIKKVSNNKYRLTFDNDKKITTTDDVIIINHLLYNKIIDEDLLNKIEIETDYYNLFNKTIKFINIRLRSTKEITLYLKKNQATNEEIDRILMKLKLLGLVNDSVFSRAFVNDKVQFSSYGPEKIRQELLEHGIELDLVDLVLNEISKEDIKNKLSMMVFKRMKINKNKSVYLLKQKLLIDFVNLGYDREMISEILNSSSYDDNIQLEREYSKIHNKLVVKYQNNPRDLSNLIKQKLCSKGFEYGKVNDFVNEKIEN